MPSTDRKLELKAKTSMAQTASQAAVYAKGLNKHHIDMYFEERFLEYVDSISLSLIVVQRLTFLNTLIKHSILYKCL
jgi:hypothetical protein